MLEDSWLGTGLSSCRTFNMKIEYNINSIQCIVRTIILSTHQDVSLFARNVSSIKINMNIMKTKPSCSRFELLWVFFKEKHKLRAAYVLFEFSSFSLWKEFFFRFLLDIVIWNQQFLNALIRATNSSKIY